MKQINITVTFKPTMFWCEQDFETPEEYEAFINRLKTDQEFLHEQLWDNDIEDQCDEILETHIEEIEVCDVCNVKYPDHQSFCPNKMENTDGFTYRNSQI